MLKSKKLTCSSYTCLYFINNENKVKNPVFQAITNENHILSMTVKDFVISGEKVLSTGNDFICTGNFTDLNIR